MSISGITRAIGRPGCLVILVLLLALMFVSFPVSDAGTAIVVSGHVSGNGDVSGLRVILVNNDAGLSFSTTLDSSGNYEFGLSRTADISANLYVETSDGTPLTNPAILWLGVPGDIVQNFDVILPTPTPAPAPTEMRFYGRVTSAIDGSPLANARVVVQVNGIQYDYTTGADGQYSITLPYPTVNLETWVAYNGRQTGTMVYTPEYFTAEMNRNWNLAAEIVATPTPTPTPAPEFLLHGYVTHADGSPYFGAHVFEVYGGVRQWYSTGETGYYQFMLSNPGQEITCWVEIDDAICGEQRHVSTSASDTIIQQDWTIATAPTATPVPSGTYYIRVHKTGNIGATVSTSYGTGKTISTSSTGTYDLAVGAGSGPAVVTAVYDMEGIEISNSVTVASPDLARGYDEVNLDLSITALPYAFKGYVYVDGVPTNNVIVSATFSDGFGTYTTRNYGGNDGYYFVGTTSNPGRVTLTANYGSLTGSVTIDSPSNRFGGGSVNSYDIYLTSPVTTRYVTVEGHVTYNGVPVSNAEVYEQYGGYTSGWITSGGLYAFSGWYLGGPMTVWAVYNGHESEHYTFTPDADSTTSHDFAITVSSPSASPVPTSTPGSGGSLDISLTHTRASAGASPTVIVTPAPTRAPTPTANPTQGTPGPSQASGQPTGHETPFPGALVTLLAVIGGCTLLYRMKK